MPANIAINGYGRIGRNILRAFFERKQPDDIRIVAINDLGDAYTNAHLTRYDSVHGPFPGTVEVNGDCLVINGERVRVLSEREPVKLPWRELDVDVALECTGLFRSRDKAALHLEAGAKKVLISAPGKDADATVVFGVNHEALKAQDKIVSNASCTTNCLAPVAKVLHEGIGIVRGIMAATHSYTNDQVLIDVYHKDLRRARSATLSQIPTSTGAAAAVGLVLPELEGKLDGFAIRVPTPNVSLVDLTFDAARETSKEEIDAMMKEAAAGALHGILGYNDQPLVSHDFNHNALSSVYDAGLTKVIGGKLAKVLAWYDNEWGFSNRMLDVARHMVG